MSAPAPPRYLGAHVKRLEDPRLLTGGGRFLDDLTLPGLLHAAFLRSPFAHAKITSIDVSAARATPGVVAVFTGDDMRRLCNPVSTSLWWEAALAVCSQPTRLLRQVYGFAATSRRLLSARSGPACF